MEWLQVAKKNDVPKGGMKFVEKEKITLANVDGKIYAFYDSCPHRKAPLHTGILKGKVLTCPFHSATFDVTTGNKLSDPVTGDTGVGNLSIYNVKIDNDNILVKV